MYCPAGKEDRMSKEYAVVSLAEGSPVFLYQTDGFDHAHVTEKQPFNDGTELWISGFDPVTKENEELLRQLRESLDANRAKEAFLSSMSHDIRTPMNAIIGLTALAKKNIDEKSKVADSLDKIETASAHLLELINEVLDMTRINSGKMVLSNEEFQLPDQLHELMIMIRPLADAKHHALQFNTSNIVCETLRGDPLRLRQVYVNIISNAVKYTPEHGKIDVSFSEELQGDTCNLRFVCQDNGVGMSSEFLARIFDPFERAETTTASGIEGTGLGMSIVRRLIEEMNGTIEIESRSGEGTCVKVSVPLGTAETAAQMDSLRGKRLLIIEGDEECRTKYSQFLQEAGTESDLVFTPSEAISALTDADVQEKPYDCVIIGTDIGPAGNVLDTAAYIRRLSASLPIVLVSDCDWGELEYAANRSGIEWFIPVPFFRQSLVNGLNRVFLEHNDETNAFAAADLSGMHILLAEDNMINREIATEILSTTNAVIDTAENGQEALDRYMSSEADHYALILMDIQMPVMDGYEAAQKIRESGRDDAKTIPIYAMTANTFAEDIAKAHAAGMNGHIAKPIDIRKLMNTLRGAVRNR